MSWTLFRGISHKKELLMIVERVEKKQKERETETERDTSRERERGREGGSEREREREGERERGGERQRERACQSSYMRLCRLPLPWKVCCVGTQNFSPSRALAIIYMNFPSFLSLSLVICGPCNYGQYIVCILVSVFVCVPMCVCVCVCVFKEKVSD